MGPARLDRHAYPRLRGLVCWQLRPAGIARLGRLPAQCRGYGFSADDKRRDVRGTIGLLGSDWYGHGSTEVRRSNDWNSYGRDLLEPQEEGGLSDRGVVEADD